MAILARGQASSCTNPILDIFTTLGPTGPKIDVELLEFIIFDVSTPAKQLSPVQVFPSSGRATVDTVNLCPTGGKVALGHFVGDYTVDLAEPLGAHEIRWFLKRFTSDPTEITFSEEFQVIDTVAPSTADLYCQVQDFRDLGVSVTDINDNDLEELIRTTQSLLDRATRQWFNERDLQFTFDGTDSDALHFGVPIISIEWLKLNTDPNPLSTDLYRVYSGRSYPDDRRNPRIKLIGPDEHRDIFVAPLTTGRLRFRKGRQNQEIKGKFGFVEDDGSTPKPITRALKKMVIERITSPLFVPTGGSTPPPPPPTTSGVVAEERTDGHSIKYLTATVSSRKAGATGISSDPEVQDIIKMYRAPIGLATPAHWSYD